MENKEREKGIYKVTLIGSFVNLLLVLFKFAAGFWGHSAAMIADAVHSLSDFVTDIIVVIFVHISGKPKDASHKYGHGKFETLATLFIGVILLLVGLGIAYSGTSNIISVIQGNTLPSPGKLALVAAILSVFSKEVLYRYTIIWGEKLNSSVLKANAWHHRSDAFSSIGTGIGIAGAIFLGSTWTVLDPIAALVVSFFIIKAAVSLVKSAIGELMEESLPDEIEEELASIISSFTEVCQLHNLHTRKIGNNYAIEFHIRMSGDTSLFHAHDTITKIEKKIRGHYGQSTHIMIHMEPLK